MEGRIPVGIYVKYFKAGGGVLISLLVFLLAIISRVCIVLLDMYFSIT